MMKMSQFWPKSKAIALGKWGYCRCGMNHRKCSKTFDRHCINLVMDLSRKSLVRTMTSKADNCIN